MAHSRTRLAALERLIIHQKVTCARSGTSEQLEIHRQPRSADTGDDSPAPKSSLPYCIIGWLARLTSAEHIPKISSRFALTGTCAVCGAVGQLFLEDVMEHRTSAELKGFAEVIRPQELSKKELLERWVLALERREDARLRTLRETEYKTAEEQSALREENSPLTVAFEDPILRSAGLTSDRLGDAARFFGLSHWQLHEVVCNCHFGETVSARVVAARVRRLSGRTNSFAAFAYVYATAAALLAGTILLSH